MRLFRKKKKKNLPKYYYTVVVNEINTSLGLFRATIYKRGQRVFVALEYGDTPEHAAKAAERAIESLLEREKELADYASKAD